MEMILLPSPNAFQFIKSYERTVFIALAKTSQISLVRKKRRSNRLKCKAKHQNRLQYKVMNLSVLFYSMTSGNAEMFCHDEKMSKQTQNPLHFSQITFQLIDDKII